MSSNLNEAALQDANVSREAWLNYAESWLNDQLELYGTKGIAISDLSRTVETLAGFFEGGSKSFHIVSDFDATLTKYWVSPGNKFIGGHDIIASTDLVSFDFITKLKELRNNFVSYETSFAYSLQEKADMLVSWYHQIHQLYIDEGLIQQDLRKMASQVRTIYRDGTQELLNLSELKGIPLLIVSAGVRDIIEALLESDGLLKVNLKVLSNKMIFSSEAPYKLVKFAEPYVHVFNKGDIEIPLDSAHHRACVQRQNLLLIGDSLGDVNMGVKLPHKNLLKVGFLNYDVENLLPHYLASFDVVILGDNTLAFADNLLKQLN